jgi:acyl carrier protein
MTPDAAARAVSTALRDVAPEADLAVIDRDGLLQEELDLDSIDFLNLVAAVQEATGCEIPERDFPRLATYRGFVSYLAAAPGAP